VYTLHFDNMLEGYQHNNFPYKFKLLFPCTDLIKYPK
jgi:hypothetical protein